MSYDVDVVALISLVLSAVGGAAVTVWRVGALQDSVDGLADKVDAVREAVSGVSERVARMEGAHAKEWAPGDD